MSIKFYRRIKCVKLVNVCVCVCVCVCVFLFFYFFIFYFFISCRSLGDNSSLVTWPWPARQRGKDICLYSEASSRLRASPPVLFKGYWPLLSQLGLKLPAHPHVVPRFLCMEPYLRSPICFHGVFKGRVPFYEYYGLESLTFTPLKKGVEQGYDRRVPLFHCIRHCC